MFRDTVPAPDPLAGPSPSPGGAGMAKLVKEEGTIMQEEEVRKKWRKKRKERNMLCRRRNRNHLQRYRPTQRVHFQTLVLVGMPVSMWYFCSQEDREASSCNQRVNKNNHMIQKKPIVNIHGSAMFKYTPR